MRTGKIHTTTTGQMRDGHGSLHGFKEWRLCIINGYIRATFRKKDMCMWTSPFNCLLRWDVKLNAEEWAMFEKEFEALIEKQKVKHPDIHKKQKSDAIKDLNYKRKHWPGMVEAKMEDKDTREWSEKVLSICRKKFITDGYKISGHYQLAR